MKNETDIINPYFLFVVLHMYIHINIYIYLWTHACTYYLKHVDTHAQNCKLIKAVETDFLKQATGLYMGLYNECLSKRKQCSMQTTGIINIWWERIKRVNFAIIKRRRGKWVKKMHKITLYRNWNLECCNIYWEIYLLTSSVIGYKYIKSINKQRVKHILKIAGNLSLLTKLFFTEGLRTEHNKIYRLCDESNLTNC